MTLKTNRGHWGNFASSKSSPGVTLHEKCRTPQSSLTWIDCKIQKHISSLTCDCTDLRPTEESNAHSFLPFWSLAGPYQFERKLKTDVHGLPMCFLWTTKPTTSRLKPFNIHTVPRAVVKRGFIVKKAKQEDCLEKTLKKTHLKSTSPAPGSLAGFGQPGQLVLNPSPITLGGTPHMKGVGTLVGHFELKP